MPKIVPIVEGDGEVTAVPVLLSKLLARLRRADIQVAPPKNAHGRGNLQKPDGVERFVRHAWKERECGAILILIDTEGECAVEIARDFSTRIRAIGVLYPVVIVCATRMYETWLLASWETLTSKELKGRAGLTIKHPPKEDVELIRGPKSRLNDYFPPNRIYKETEDQEALTRLLDPDKAHARSRSFRRLWRALEQAVAAIDANAKIVTPAFPPDARPTARKTTATKRGRSAKSK